MAFSYTVERERNDGRFRVIHGTFTNADGSTGGDIYTELTEIHDFELQHSGSAVVADEPVINETLPLEKENVTIVTTANADGYWMAKGI